MPRTKLQDKYCAPRRHECDRVKALILEAVRTQNVSSEAQVAMAGCGKTAYYAMLSKHSDTWPLCRIKGLCAGLNIPVESLQGAIRY